MQALSSDEAGQRRTYILMLGSYFAFTTPCLRKLRSWSVDWYFLLGYCILQTSIGRENVEILSYPVPRFKPHNT